MYEPEHKSKLYLLIVAIVAILIGWVFFARYRPMLIEASCNEAAAKSSGLFYTKGQEFFDSSFTYENLKERCVQDIRYAQK